MDYTIHGAIEQDVQRTSPRLYGCSETFPSYWRCYLAWIVMVEIEGQE